MMEFMTAQEAGQKWKLSSRMIAYYCASGRIPGVEKKGNVRKLQFLSDISTRYSENRRWSIIAPLKRKQTQLFMYATNLPVSIQGCIHRHIKIFTCALSAIGSATR